MERGYDRAREKGGGAGDRVSGGVGGNSAVSGRGRERSRSLDERERQIRGGDRDRSRGRYGIDTSNKGTSTPERWIPAPVPPGPVRTSRRLADFPGSSGRIQCWTDIMILHPDKSPAV